MQHPDDKQCSKCGVAKPPEAFPRNRNKSGGREVECKRCKRQRESTTEAIEAKRARSLKNNYGITLEQYEQMHKAQRGLCAICKQPERALTRDGERKPLAVDHCHITQRVRGLACSACNRGLGLFNENPELLLAAAVYASQAQAVKEVAGGPDTPDRR